MLTETQVSRTNMVWGWWKNSQLSFLLIAIICFHFWMLSHSFSTNIFHAHYLTGILDPGNVFFLYLVELFRHVSKFWHHRSAFGSHPDISFSDFIFVHLGIMQCSFNFLHSGTHCVRVFIFQVQVFILDGFCKVSYGCHLEERLLEVLAEWPHAWLTMLSLKLRDMGCICKGTTGSFLLH